MALGLAAVVGTITGGAALPADSSGFDLLAIAEPPAAPAPDLSWVDFAALNWVDRAAAQAALAPMFGDDPELWPHWLEPRAVVVPSGRNTILVVREPLHAPCGQYGFVVFGPARADATRDRLDGEFCAGDMAVVPVSGQAVPDLVFREGRQQDPQSGAWQRRDQRVRWGGKGWLLIKTG